MRINKVLIKIFFPQIDKWYEIWIPQNQTINSIITQLIKGLNELNDDIIQYNSMPILYNRSTGDCYNNDSYVYDTNIKNGAELILL